MCMCMSVYTIILCYSIGMCAGRDIHGNNCEVSAHTPPSYIVNMLLTRVMYTL